MTQRIYQVVQADHDGAVTLGMFASLEKAEAYAHAVENIGGGAVEIREHELDSVAAPTTCEWAADLSRSGEIFDINARPVMQWQGRPSHLFASGDRIWATVVAATEDEARLIITRLVARAQAEKSRAGDSWMIEAV